MDNIYQYVDITFLQNLTGGSAGTTIEIISLFKSEVPKYLADLRKSIEENNLDNVAYTAHKAKSSFALMGIGDVVTALKDMEISAKSLSGAEKFSATVDQVERIYFKAIEELDRYAGTL